MAITNSTANLNGPINFAAGGDGLDRKMRIRRLRWEGNTTAGDDLKVVDYDSGVIYIETKAPANGNIEWDFGAEGRDFPNGLKVTTIDSGVLRAWL